MNNSYHIFVIITTVIFYIFLVSKKNTEDYNYMHVLYVPIILYSGYYFIHSPSPEVYHSDVNISVSQDLLSDLYPVSSNSNSV